MLAGVESNLRSDQTVAGNAAYTRSGLRPRTEDNQMKIVYIFLSLSLFLCINLVV